jgi:UPF0755 protein
MVLSRLRRILRLPVHVFMRLLKWLFLLALLTTGLIAGWFALRPLPMQSASVEFSVPPGASLRTAARTIEAAGIALAAWQFEWMGRLLGRAEQIKAGNYEVTGSTTALELLNKLTRGDVSQIELVLIEGRTFREFHALLSNAPELNHEMVGLRDAEILKRIGASESSPEGLFFPDTYRVNKNASDLAVLKRAYLAMQRELDAAWTARNPDLPLKTPYELLILASIVEKETGLASDRPQIAAVFVNRLRLGMLLQADPTVIYGLGERFNGNLRRIDLEADTPWNTYTRRGLPPTPISLPGRDALRAAANPPASDKLYFVARGDGTSVFSNSLEAHNRAVADYQKGNR